MFAGRPVIGIVGGIGAGKSTVARLFADEGCFVIDSDQLVREAYSLPAVRQQLRRWWGDEPFAADGSIDRASIARRVFADPQERRRLEGLLHPLVEQMRQERMAQAAADPQVKAFVLDTPLLVETGLYRQCDAVVMIEVPADVRLARVQRQRGWSAPQWAEREKAQAPLDKKREIADYMVSNTADAADDVRHQVRQVLSRILADLTSGAPKAVDEPS